MQVATPGIDPILRLGANNLKVQELQELLNGRLPSGDRLTVDSFFVFLASKPKGLSKLSNITSFSNKMVLLVLSPGNPCVLTPQLTNRYYTVAVTVNKLQLFKKFFLEVNFIKMVQLMVYLVQKQKQPCRRFRKANNSLSTV